LQVGHHRHAAVAVAATAAKQAKLLMAGLGSEG